jgi:ribonuclease HI
LRRKLHADNHRVAVSFSDPGFGGAEIHSNNTAELSALLESLRWYDSHPELLTSTSSIRIISDSKYVLNMLQSDWRPRVHLTLISNCQQLIRSISLLTPISLFWSRAHTGASDYFSYWNNEADALAKRGISLVGTPLPLQPPPLDDPPPSSLHTLVSQGSISSLRPPGPLDPRPRSPPSDQDGPLPPPATPPSDVFSHHVLFPHVMSCFSSTSRVGVG